MGTLFQPLRRPVSAAASNYFGMYLAGCSTLRDAFTRCCLAASTARLQAGFVVATVRNVLTPATATSMALSSPQESDDPNLCNVVVIPRAPSV
jgi:hypothetical protein